MTPAPWVPTRGSQRDVMVHLVVGDQLEEGDEISLVFDYQTTEVENWAVKIRHLLPRRDWTTSLV